ncbi:MAG: 23S rRNA (pseudouridine(1915)-N(3))-methyltransferase RlmH [Bacilli bacterium]
MMIKIICVGKLKEKYLRDAVTEYSKRMSRYTKLSIIELDSGNNNKSSDLEKEKNKIMKNIDEHDFVITLEIDGKMLSSVELAKKIDETLMINSNLIFVIGGSDGLHLEVKKRSNYKLSFSKMTFPHQLFRVLLLEQIYRSFKIIKNESYHK